MDSPLLLDLAGIAIAIFFGAMLLGFFLQRGCGVALLLMAAAIASGLAIAGVLLVNWPGLLVAVLLVGGLAAIIGHRLGAARGARFLSLMWLGFCVSCAVGYWVGGRWGLLAITLPANLLFWVTLYVLSRFILPVQDRTERRQAFRALLTYSLGTNFPYHVMKDRRLEQRVAGNPVKAFFGGPGIVITGCDHLAVLTNGRNILVPQEPGLMFTERFQVVQQVVDLRPQLRTFPVEACTEDGIPICVQTFIPFRIQWNGQEPALGKSFPIEDDAIFQAVTGEMVEEQQDLKHNWDDLVEIHATQILRDILSRFKFDDLCMALGPHTSGPEAITVRYASDDRPVPPNPVHDPRQRIQDEMLSRLTRDVAHFGIEILDGCIDNLLPLNEALMTKRIENWRTKWRNRISLVQAKGEAIRANLEENARVEVEQKLLIRVSEMLGESIAQGQDMSDELMAATLVASLERMAENPRIRELLPPDTETKIAHLRSIGRPLRIEGS